MAVETRAGDDVDATVGWVVVGSAFIALAPAVTAGLFGTVGLAGSSDPSTPRPGSADSSDRRSWWRWR